jgi:hypothetical protein
MVPIHQCRLLRAVEGDAEARVDTVLRAEKIPVFGGFTVFPCLHTPPCRPMTEAEWDLVASFEGCLPMVAAIRLRDIKLAWEKVRSDAGVQRQ